MSIRKCEKDLWGEIILNVDIPNEKNIQKRINELKRECKKVYENKRGGQK